MIHMKTITVTVVTKGDEPVQIDRHTLAKVELAVDQALKMNLNLDYRTTTGPVIGANRRHEYVGVNVAA